MSDRATIIRLVYTADDDADPMDFEDWLQARIAKLCVEAITAGYGDEFQPEVDTEYLD